MDNSLCSLRSQEKKVLNFLNKNHKHLANAVAHARPSNQATRQADYLRVDCHW